LFACHLSRWSSRTGEPQIRQACGGGKARPARREHHDPASHAASSAPTIAAATINKARGGPQWTTRAGGGCSVELIPEPGKPTVTRRPGPQPAKRRHQGRRAGAPSWSTPAIPASPAKRLARPRHARPCRAKFGGTDTLCQYML